MVAERTDGARLNWTAILSLGGAFAVSVGIWFAVIRTIVDAIK